MAKSSPSPAEATGKKGPRAGRKVVRDPVTGQFVTVKGIGVLKDSDLKIKKGLSLLKPIAQQALTRQGKR